MQDSGINIDINILDKNQENLSRNLDALNDIYFFCKNKKPSDLYKGAIFAMNNQNNPDWMAQSAHSLRDIIYGIQGNKKDEKYKVLSFFCSVFSVKYQNKKDNNRSIIRKTFFNFSDQKTRLYSDILCELYGIFTDISHHLNHFKRTKKRIRKIYRLSNINISVSDVKDVDLDFFKKLFFLFEDILLKSIPAFLSVYKRIDVILSRDISENIIDELKYYFYLGDNIENYFFTKVLEDWFDWLLENNFLLLSGSKGDNRDFYKLNYLIRVAQKSPDKIISFINSVNICQYEFKQEIINKFLWLLSHGNFTVDHLCQVVDKIVEDNWVQLVGDLNSWGFDYNDIMEKLYKAEKYDEFLALVGIVLTVKEKDNKKEEGYKFNNIDPFYFNDFKDIHIFKEISELNKNFLEKALELTTKKSKELIEKFSAEVKDDYWDYFDSFVLPNEIDFFSSDYSNSFYSERNGVRDLFLTIRNLIVRLSEEYNNDGKEAISIYKKYIEILPKTEMTWKLKIFFLYHFSNVLSDKVKEAIFIVEKKDLNFINSVEYQKLLKGKFNMLENKEKEKFVEDLIDFLGNNDEDKKYYISYGNKIFSCIYKYLEQDQINILENKFGVLVSDYEPKAEVYMRSGFVNPKPAQGLPSDIEELVKELKNNLSVEGILKKNKSNDMFRPHSVDMAIQEDIKKRIDEYIEKADLFFERELLDEHYTYIYLQAIRDYLKNLKNEVKINYKKILNLFSNIIKSHNKKNFDLSEREQNFYHDWLGGWGAVFDMIADIINELLKDNREYEIINFKEDRDDFFALIKKLLVFSDPSVDDNNKEDGPDPLNTALNSVRGNTFQSLIYLICRDSDDFDKKEKSKIKDDVKEVFKKVVEEEETYALFFEFGHYLGQVYFRDKDWTKSLLEKIFPVGPEKNDLFLASLEGYLSGNLYNGLFEDMENVYSTAIKIKSNDYTKRRYFRDINEGLSAHLALAFIYFNSFNSESELFKDFWSEDNYNQKRQKEFISFIGKHVISRDENDIDLSKIDVDKIFNLWEILLDSVSDKEVLSAFSFWINFKSNIYKDEERIVDIIVKTIKKSDGALEWEYNLMKSLVYLSEKYPEKTFEIINCYLRGNYINNTGQFKYSFYIDDDIFNSLDIIYKSTGLQKEIGSLISDLLPIGNGQFWKLKEISK